MPAVMIKRLTFVSYDGTWQKRGHSSHNGIAIDILTGYVVDFEVLANLCIYYEKQKQKEEEMPLSCLKRASERHEGKCQRNDDGSSNAMEVKAAKNAISSQQATVYYHAK